MESVNWTLILWVGGGLGTLFLSVITWLLAWIVRMQGQANKFIIQKDIEQDGRLSGHDKKFEEQHNEIHEIALQNKETLTIMKLKYKIK